MAPLLSLRWEGPVLLIDGAPDPTAFAMRALAGRGADPEVEVVPSPQSDRLLPSSVPADCQPKAIAIAGKLPEPQRLLSRLEDVREALPEDGRLLLVEGRGSAQSSLSDAVRALSEIGFCVLQETSRENLWALEARPDPYVIRSYREGDEEEILRLFAASFSPPRSLDHWRWKYRENPFGDLAISCAFSPDDELVAHYAAYPVPFRRSADGGRETMLCHQVGDTMTARHVRHRGRGRTSLLARTARHFYARFCEGRVAFNYGFNTGNIQRFSELFAGARKVWDVEVRAAGIAALPPRTRGKKRYRASRIDRLGAAFDQLFEAVAPHYGLLVQRDRRYLRWRYLRCPDRDFRFYRIDRGSRLVGWGVFHVEGEALVWGDALFDRDHPKAVETLLHAAAQEAPRAARVEGWFSRHPPWWDEILCDLGFDAEPEPQGLGMVYVPFVEDPGEELRTGYYLCRGDSDLF